MATIMVAHDLALLSDPTALWDIQGLVLTPCHTFLTLKTAKTSGRGGRADSIASYGSQLQYFHLDIEIRHRISPLLEESSAQNLPVA